MAKTNNTSFYGVWNGYIWPGPIVPTSPDVEPGATIVEDVLTDGVGPVALEDIFDPEP